MDILDSGIATKWRDKCRDIRKSASLTLKSRYGVANNVAICGLFFSAAIGNVEPTKAWAAVLACSCQHYRCRTGLVSRSRSRRSGVPMPLRLSPPSPDRRADAVGSVAAAVAVVAFQCCCYLSLLEEMYDALDSDSVPWLLERALLVGCNSE